MLFRKFNLEKKVFLTHARKEKHEASVYEPRRKNFSYHLTLYSSKTRETRRRGKLSILSRRKYVEPAPTER